MFNKIVLAYERLDMKTMLGGSFNGRNEPIDNPISKEAFNEMNPFLQNAYREVIEPETSLYNTGIARNNLLFHAVLKNHDMYVRKSINELSPGEKYYYPINIINANLYFEFVNRISISPRVLDDARNGLARIIFIYQAEGDMMLKREPLRKLVQDLNVPKESVALFHGDFNTDTFKKEPYLYFPVNTFPWWVESFKRNHISEYNPDKLYSCYNRNLREYRIHVIGMLYRHGLINDGLVSFGITNEKHMRAMAVKMFNGDISEEEIQFLVDLMGTSPDGKHLINENPAGDIVDEHYRNTFLSLITETEADKNNVIFFSEKIYKPLLVGHPFILVGGQHQMAKLREMGFQTFSKWWDESYDGHLWFQDRFKAIISVLQTLKNKPVEELVEIRKEMIPVLEHNQKLYNRIAVKNTYADHLPIMQVLSKWNW